MLYYELIRDDVLIRSESLSYFTLFSLMPIVAGLFLLMKEFFKSPSIQSDLQDLIGRILEPLPPEHREHLLALLFGVKDIYLQRISTGSSTLVCFAFVVLIVIVGKVYINLEDLMNRIWSAPQNRPWFERVRNLILGMMILPTLIFVALSIPNLLDHFAEASLGTFVKKGLPAVLLMSGLFFLFRYFPNVDVKPKNAIKGALLSGVLFFISNTLLTAYFRFGTLSFYGKAGVFPLLAFFVYVSWVIVMVGAEWSYVLQNEDRLAEEMVH